MNIVTNNISDPELNMAQSVVDVPEIVALIPDEQLLLFRNAAVDLKCHPGAAPSKKTKLRREKPGGLRAHDLRDLKALPPQPLTALPIKFLELEKLS